MYPAGWETICYCRESLGYTLGPMSRLETWGYDLSKSEFAALRTRDVA